MPKIKIDQSRCKGCELCALYCPKGLISVGNSLNTRGAYPAIFNPALSSSKLTGGQRKSGAGQCSGCTFCALICPDACITVYK